VEYAIAARVIEMAPWPIQSPDVLIAQGVDLDQSISRVAIPSGKSRQRHLVVVPWVRNRQGMREVGAPAVVSWFAGHGSAIIDHGRRYTANTVSLADRPLP
jgi:hypothetical protein